MALSIDELRELKERNFTLSSFFYEDHPEASLPWDSAPESTNQAYLDQLGERNYLTNLHSMLTAAIEKSTQSTPARTALIQEFSLLEQNTQLLHLMEIKRLQSQRRDKNQPLTQTQEQWLTSQMQELSADKAMQLFETSFSEKQLNELIEQRRHLRNNVQKRHFELFREIALPIPEHIKENTGLHHFLRQSPSSIPSQLEIASFETQVENAAQRNNAFQAQEQRRIAEINAQFATIQPSAEDIITRATPLLPNLTMLGKIDAKFAKNKEIQVLTSSLLTYKKNLETLTALVNEPHKTMQSVEAINALCSHLDSSTIDAEQSLKKLNEARSIYEKPYDNSSQQHVRAKLSKLMEALDYLHSLQLLNALKREETQSTHSSLMNQISAAAVFLNSLDNEDAKKLGRALQSRSLEESSNTSFSQLFTSAWPEAKPAFLPKRNLAFWEGTCAEKMLTLYDSLSIDTAKDISAIKIKAYQEEKEHLTLLSGQLDLQMKNLEMRMRIAESDIPGIRVLDPRGKELACVENALLLGQQHVAMIQLLKKEMANVLSQEDTTSTDEYLHLTSIRSQVEQGINTAKQLSQSMTFQCAYGEALVRRCESDANEAIKAIGTGKPITPKANLEQLDFLRLRRAAGEASSILLDVTKQFCTRESQKITKVESDLKRFLEEQNKTIPSEFANLMQLNGRFNEDLIQFFRNITRARKEISTLEKSSPSDDKLKGIKMVERSMEKISAIEPLKKMIGEGYAAMQHAINLPLYKKQEKILIALEAHCITEYAKHFKASGSDTKEMMQSLMTKVTNKEPLPKDILRLAEHYHELHACQQGYMKNLKTSARRGQSPVSSCAFHTEAYQKTSDNIMQKYSEHASDIKKYYAHANDDGSRSHRYIASMEGATVKESLKQLKGDALKTKILLAFKTELDSITSKEELDTFVTQFKDTQEYSVLKTSQGWFTKAFDLKTSSVEAFDQMVVDKEGELQNLKNLSS